MILCCHPAGVSEFFIIIMQELYIPSQSRRTKDLTILFPIFTRINTLPLALHPPASNDYTTCPALPWPHLISLQSLKVNNEQQIDIVPKPFRKTTTGRRKYLRPGRNMQLRAVEG